MKMWSECCCTGDEMDREGIVRVQYERRMCQSCIVNHISEHRLLIDPCLKLILNNNQTMGGSTAIEQYPRGGSAEDKLSLG